MRGECNSKTGKLSFTGLDTAEPTLILCKDSESMAHHKVRNVFFYFAEQCSLLTFV